MHLNVDLTLHLLSRGRHSSGEALPEGRRRSLWQKGFVRPIQGVLDWCVGTAPEWIAHSSGPVALTRNNLQWWHPPVPFPSFRIRPRPSTRTSDTIAYTFPWDRLVLSKGEPAPKGEGLTPLPGAQPPGSTSPGAAPGAALPTSGTHPSLGTPSNVGTSPNGSPHPAGRTPAPRESPRGRRASKTGQEDAMDEAQRTFIHFISTGSLPASEHHWTLAFLQNHLHQQLQADHHFFGAPAGESAFCIKLLSVLLENKNALPRLLTQTGETLLEELYAHTMDSGIVSRWTSWLSDVPGLDIKTLRWKTLLLSLSYTGGRISLENYPKVEKGIVLYLLREMLPPQLFRWVSQLPSAKLEKLLAVLEIPHGAGFDLVEVLSHMRAQASHLVLPEPSAASVHAIPDTYVENAGLILLSPFLPKLFQELGWVDGMGFVQEGLHQRAVLLSQHLVHPAEVIPEYQLPLNKLLCGYPMDSTLPLSLDEDSSRELEKAVAMLHAMQTKWTMNGQPVNAGIHALRQSFLHRRGKLVRRQNDWLLHVEQKAYDVLLNSLTWNTRLIRLPWMSEDLWVEWV